MGENTENSNENFVETKRSEPVDGISELMKINKKTLFYQRISALCIVGIFLVAAISAYILVPKAKASLESVDGLAARAQASMDLLDEMSNSLIDTSENLNKLVDDNSTLISDTMTSISEIDFEGLNQAIKDLQETVGPLASFFGRFN